MNEQKYYYYVYRVGNNGPTKKHNTIKSAHDEAIRLIKMHPKDTFEILMCLAKVEIKKETLWANEITTFFQE